MSPPALLRLFTLGHGWVRGAEVLSTPFCTQIVGTTREARWAPQILKGWFVFYVAVVDPSMQENDRSA